MIAFLISLMICIQPPNGDDFVLKPSQMYYLDAVIEGLPSNVFGDNNTSLLNKTEYYLNDLKRGDVIRVRLSNNSQFYFRSQGIHSHPFGFNYTTKNKNAIDVVVNSKDCKEITVVNPHYNMIRIHLKVDSDR